MRRRREFRFPLVDLVIILALLLICWAVFLLARIEPRISSVGRQSEALTGIFKECQRLFRENGDNLELERRKFDLSWYEALTLKAEYLGVAARLRSELPALEAALTNSGAAKGPGELTQGTPELKTWIAKQIDRVALERLEARSKDLKAAIARAQLEGTNGPVAITQDLGVLLGEIDNTYQTCLSEFRGVADNSGKPMVGAAVALHRARATQAVALLSHLADQAQWNGKAIELFLQNQASEDTTRRRLKQEELIQALSKADSPADLVSRARMEAEAGNSPLDASAREVRSLREARYGLLAALAGLGVFLIIDWYWRAVVMPLRLKLMERDSLAEHQKKLAHFEELAAELAHEIRNPLTTISALVHTIQRKLEESTPEHRDALVIRSEIDRISQILKDFIQLSRPSAPNLALMRAEPLLKKVRDLMVPQLQPQGVRLESQTQGRAWFYGDQQQLSQVLTNLIRNAAESIDQDGGEVIVRARDERMPFKGTSTNVAVIEVQDNGPGIRPEVQGRLFEPFFSTKKEGTGLGLPISARIIDGHGGTLDYETQVGQGTVFRIVLPAHEAGE